MTQEQFAARYSVTDREVEPPPPPLDPDEVWVREGTGTRVRVTNTDGDMVTVESINTGNTVDLTRAQFDRLYQRVDETGAVTPTRTPTDLQGYLAADEDSHRALARWLVNSDRAAHWSEDNNGLRGAAYGRLREDERNAWEDATGTPPFRSGVPEPWVFVQWDGNRAEPNNQVTNGVTGANVEFYATRGEARQAYENLVNRFEDTPTAAPVRVDPPPAAWPPRRGQRWASGNGEEVRVAGFTSNSVMFENGEEVSRADFETNYTMVRDAAPTRRPSSGASQADVDAALADLAPAESPGRRYEQATRPSPNADPLDELLGGGPPTTPTPNIEASTQMSFGPPHRGRIEDHPSYSNVVEGVVAFTNMDGRANAEAYRAWFVRNNPGRNWEPAMTAAAPFPPINRFTNIETTMIQRPRELTPAQEADMMILGVGADPEDLDEARILTVSMVRGSQWWSWPGGTGPFRRNSPTSHTDAEAVNSALDFLLESNDAMRQHNLPQWRFLALSDFEDPDEVDATTEDRQFGTLRPIEEIVRNSAEARGLSYERGVIDLTRPETPPEPSAPTPDRGRPLPPVVPPRPASTPPRSVPVATEVTEVSGDAEELEQMIDNGYADRALGEYLLGGGATDASDGQGNGIVVGALGDEEREVMRRHYDDTDPPDPFVTVEWDDRGFWDISWWPTERDAQSYFDDISSAYPSDDDDDEEEAQRERTVSAIESLLQPASTTPPPIARAGMDEVQIGNTMREWYRATGQPGMWSYEGGQITYEPITRYTRQQSVTATGLRADDVHGHSDVSVQSVFTSGESDSMERLGGSFSADREGTVHMIRGSRWMTSDAIPTGTRRVSTTLTDEEAVRRTLAFLLHSNVEMGRQGRPESERWRFLVATDLTDAGYDYEEWNRINRGDTEPFGPLAPSEDVVRRAAQHFGLAYDGKVISLTTGTPQSGQIWAHRTQGTRVEVMETDADGVRIRGEGFSTSGVLISPEDFTSRYVLTDAPTPAPPPPRGSLWRDDVRGSTWRVTDVTGDTVRLQSEPGESIRHVTPEFLNLNFTGAETPATFDPADVGTLWTGDNGVRVRVAEIRPDGRLWVVVESSGYGSPWEPEPFLARHTRAAPATPTPTNAATLDLNDRRQVHVDHPSAGSLSASMEFGHVIYSHGDGTISDVRGRPYGEEIAWVDEDENLMDLGDWEVFGDIHDGSEILAGDVGQDILDERGVYVASVIDQLPEEGDEDGEPRNIGWAIFRHNSAPDPAVEALIAEDEVVEQGLMSAAERIIEDRISAVVLNPPQLWEERATPRHRYRVVSWTGDRPTDSVTIENVTTGRNTPLQMGWSTFTRRYEATGIPINSPTAPAAPAAESLRAAPVASRRPAVDSLWTDPNGNQVRVTWRDPDPGMIGTETEGGFTDQMSEAYFQRTHTPVVDRPVVARPEGMLPGFTFGEPTGDFTGLQETRSYSAVADHPIARANLTSLANAEAFERWYASMDPPGVWTAEGGSTQHPPLTRFTNNDMVPMTRIRHVEPAPSADVAAMGGDLRTDRPRSMTMLRGGRFVEPPPQWYRTATIWNDAKAVETVVEFLLASNAALRAEGNENGTWKWLVLDDRVNTTPPAEPGNPFGPVQSIDDLVAQVAGDWGLPHHGRVIDLRNPPP